MAGKKPKEKLAKVKKRVDHVVEQMKEPFTLLETLKEEGMANAQMLIGMMAGAAKNFKVENVKPQLKEVVNTLGFAKRSELENLEAKLDELESRIAELEAGAGGRDEED
jgi:polyhydroxyalkanoate synthesis regulator phasin